MWSQLGVLSADVMGLLEDAFLLEEVYVAGDGGP